MVCRCSVLRDPHRLCRRSESVGDVKIGNMAPIAVQSMTNTMTQDVASTVSQIKSLEEAGCEIIRVAVIDEEAARAIASIKKQISIQSYV